jgi:hypothetical protein
VITQVNSLALFNIGGGEIILILVLLFILALGAIVFFGLIYFIVRAAQNRPEVAPASLPPQIAADGQRRKDQQHVRFLAIFHFVFAGLGLVGIGCLFLHYFILHTVFSNPGMWKSQNGSTPPPRAFFEVFIWFYLFFGGLLLMGMVSNALSGVFLSQRKHRVFSMVIAGLDCLQVPFGTALGVFTILVLSRDSVQELYEGSSGR